MGPVELTIQFTYQRYNLLGVRLKEADKFVFTDFYVWVSYKYTPNAFDQKYHIL